MKHTTALTLVLLLTIAATPAFAAPNENKSNNGKANGHNNEKKAVQEVQALEVSIDPSGEPTISVAPSQAVSPSVTWKNHGQYVSSVAKTHPGGAVVSAAAKSDIGKKQKHNPTPSILPSATPSAAPSIEPSAEPTISTTPPITSPVEAITVGNPFTNFFNFLQSLTRYFQPFTTI